MSRSKGRLSRREALLLLTSTPGLAFAFKPGEIEAAQQAAEAARTSSSDFVPKFFTPREYETVRLLVDLIIPRDESSGSATDAGVPEFMDFMMVDELTEGPSKQTLMRGGLAWLDAYTLKRFDAPFVDLSAAERDAVLDAIANPKDTTPAQLAPGVAFFNRFRDLTATGFFTSKMGVEDLQYLGNAYLSEWNGCPEQALRKLGLI